MSCLKTRVPAVLTSDTVSARVVGCASMRPIELVAGVKERRRDRWLFVPLAEDDAAGDLADDFRGDRGGQVAEVL